MLIFRFSEGEIIIRLYSLRIGNKQSYKNLFVNKCLETLRLSLFSCEYHSCMLLIIHQKQFKVLFGQQFQFFVFQWIRARLCVII